MDFFTVLFLQFEIVISLNVSILAPDFAFKGEHIFVDCTADKAPYRGIAEFELNGELSNIVGKDKNGSCFSSVTRSYCVQSTCWCSTDGRTYGISLKISKLMKTNLTITCNIHSSSTEPEQKSISKIIHILEPIYPNINVLEKRPSNGGYRIALECSTDSPANVSFEWKCPRGQDSGTTRLKYLSFSIYEMQVGLQLNGKSCLCSMKFRTLTTTSIYTININPKKTFVNGSSYQVSSFDIEKIVLTVTSVGVFITTIGIVDIILVISIRHLTTRRYSVNGSRQQTAIYLATPEGHDANHTYADIIEPSIENDYIYPNNYDEIDDICSNNDVHLSGESNEGRMQINVEPVYLDVIA